MLLVSLAVAIVQARRMMVLRRTLLTSPDNPHLRMQVCCAGSAAGILGAALGVFSVAQVVLGACLAF